MRSSLVLGLFLVTACSASNDDPPKELKTTSSFPLEQLNASYGAFSDGKHIELFVAVLHDGFLLVRDGDNVIVDVNGTVAQVSERIEDDKVHYLGDFASPPDEPVL